MTVITAAHVTTLPSGEEILFGQGTGRARYRLTAQDLADLDRALPPPLAMH